MHRHSGHTRIPIIPLVEGIKGQKLLSLAKGGSHLHSDDAGDTLLLGVLASQPKPSRLGLLQHIQKDVAHAIISASAQHTCFAVWGFPDSSLFFWLRLLKARPKRRPVVGPLRMGAHLYSDGLGGHFAAGRAQSQPSSHSRSPYLWVNNPTLATT